MKGKQRKAKVRRAISLKPETLQKGLRMAEKQQRNFSNLIETLIVQEAQEASMAK